MKYQNLTRHQIDVTGTALWQAKLVSSARSGEEKDLARGAWRRKGEGPRIGAQAESPVN
jgi:hypothetical protein